MSASFHEIKNKTSQTKTKKLPIFHFYSSNQIMVKLRRKRTVTLERKVTDTHPYLFFGLQYDKKTNGLNL